MESHGSQRRRVEVRQHRGMMLVGLITKPADAPWERGSHLTVDPTAPSQPVSGPSTQRSGSLRRVYAVRPCRVQYVYELGIGRRPLANSCDPVFSAVTSEMSDSAKPERDIVMIELLRQLGWVTSVLCEPGAAWCVKIGVGLEKCSL